MDYIRHHLAAKLLLSYCAIIVTGVLVLLMASQAILPATFNHHMSGMGMMSTGMMDGTNPGGMSQLYVDFRASFNEALFYAALVAMVVAVILSLYLSRSVIAPVHAMSIATQRMTEGHYDEHVQVGGEDELAQLARHFNGMAEKLSQVEAMRRQLIGDVSHELRTPLTAIKGSMEALVDGVLPATPETFQQIQGEAERLNRLVDDLQELSRVEARAYQLEIHPLDVAGLIHTVMKRLSHQAEHKGIALQVDVPANLPKVLGDEDRTIQVLMNLLGNAIQYTSEKGRIIMLATKVNEGVRFSIQDSGIGISREHLAHIFDRFYRVDKSRSRQSGGGSGIGLTIARALVEAQAGQIWVESAAAGQGSTFSFTLPASK